jgi:hypothetical protein
MNVEKFVQKWIYAPKYRFHCAKCHKTQNHSINSTAHVLQQTSTKSDKKHKKDQQHLIYAFKGSIVFHRT